MLLDQYQGFSVSAYSPELTPFVTFQILT